MDKWIHPAFFFLIGSLLLPFVKGKAKKCFILFIPVLSIVDVAFMKVGTLWKHTLPQYESRRRQGR